MIPTPDELWRLVYGHRATVAAPDLPPAPPLRRSTTSAQRVSPPLVDEPAAPIGQVILLALVFVLWLAAAIVAWVMGL